MTAKLALFRLSYYAYHLHLHHRGRRRRRRRRLYYHNINFVIFLFFLVLDICCLSAVFYLRPVRDSFSLSAPVIAIQSFNSVLIQETSDFFAKASRTSRYFSICTCF